MSAVHVVPVHDLIEHDSGGGDCPCGPTVEPVYRFAADRHDARRLLRVYGYIITDLPVSR